MAKTSMKIKQARPAKFSTSSTTAASCAVVPTPISGNHGVCRICFRELAYKGERDPRRA